MNKKQREYMRANPPLYLVDDDGPTQRHVQLFDADKPVPRIDAEARFQRGVRVTAVALVLFALVAAGVCGLLQLAGVLP